MKKIILIPFAILAFLGLAGLVVRELWNAVMPRLADGVHTIDFFTALGLLLLCRILFGGFSKGGGPNKWRKDGQPGPPWANLKPEDKSHLKQYWREKWEKSKWCTPSGNAEVVAEQKPEEGKEA